MSIAIQNNLVLKWVRNPLPRKIASAFALEFA